MTAAEAKALRERQAEIWREILRLDAESKRLKREYQAIQSVLD